MLTVTIEFTYHFFDTDFIVADSIKLAMFQMNENLIHISRNDIFARWLLSAITMQYSHSVFTNQSHRILAMFQRVR